MLISICICTYQRPVLLRRLLQDVAGLDTGGLFSFEVVIADNDAAASGKAVVEEAAAAARFRIDYAIESRRSISYARNSTLARARGDLIAFIDDDEFPHRDWLLNMFKTLTANEVAAVLGPVRPFFEEGTPPWVIKGGFYYRPEHPTGHRMPWTECRTGNVLLNRKIIAGDDPVFDPKFGTGGSDVDFFRRKSELGHVFIWCNEGVVEEVVPPNRWRRSVMMRRALLRGQNSFRQPRRRWFNVGKAVLAIPLYLIALPLLFLAGQHLFMKYLIKLCDHTGRLLASVGITPVRERAM